MENTKSAAPGRWIPLPGVDLVARGRADLAFLSIAERRAVRGAHSGVFARVDIPAGTVLVHQWHDTYYVGMVGWDALSVEAIEALPERLRELFYHFGLDADFGVIYGPMGEEFVTTLDNYINHACAPNVGYDADGSLVPLRDISAGEELRLDYGSFVVNYDESFDCLCGHPLCRGRVTREDWRLLAARPGVILPPFVRRRVAREAEPLSSR
jgi:hypothetical protein